MPDYLRHFPKPVLQDLITGKWLPVVGAGMSRNAIVPKGKQLPLWNELGRIIADELSDYSYSGPVDAISAYSHEFGPARLVEKLVDLLLIESARPGDAHRAFCSILFDIVCTTNLDFLLERQYEASARYCRPVVDEDQLVVSGTDGSTLLLKLHGDVHHPKRMVVTEEDYDCFLDRYPLLATYLANLLITRTAVLIGYSLDDPDFRQIWQVIGDRLGKSRRLAYALMVDPKGSDVTRFERRGVKVIALPGSMSKYGQILADTFDQLREYLQNNVIRVSHVTEEEPLTELSLPKDAATRLCFFGLPLAVQPLYREQVFPLAERAGLVPVTAADVIGPGGSYAAKVDAIMRRSTAVVLDVSSQNTYFELGLIRSIERSIPTLVIVQDELPQGALAGLDLGRDVPAHEFRVLHRSSRPISEQPGVLEQMEHWFRTVATRIAPELAEEPLRLFEVKQYRAAVIAAMTYLESLLRRRMEFPVVNKERFLGMNRIVSAAAEVQVLTADEIGQIREWMKVRNAAVHTQDPVGRATANRIVKGVIAIAARLTDGQ